MDHDQREAVGRLSDPAGRAVYELVKWGNVVTPVWFVWDGRRLVSEEAGGR